MITQMLLAGGGFLPESKAYFDAMAVQLTGAQKNVVDKLIRSLINSTAWTYLGGMWISTLITEQQTFLNLLNPTDSDTTRVKVGSPTFTSGVGWTGANSNSHCLETNGYANNAKFKLAQQDHMMLSYVSNNGSVGQRGVIGFRNRYTLMPERTAGVLSGYMGRNSPIGGGGGTTVNEVKIAMRASSSDARVISNKTLYGFDTTAASDAIPSSYPVYFLTNGDSWPSSAQTRLEAVGQGSMPDATRESMVDAINNFIIQWDAI